MICIDFAKETYAWIRHIGKVNYSLNLDDNTIISSFMYNFNTSVILVSN